MPNPVLESLRAQRAEQIATMDAILDQVDERDLVDAERGLLEASRERIKKIDEQIAPLAEYEALRDAHDATVSGLPTPPARTSPRSIAGPERAPIYSTAGSFLVDYLRGNGILERGVRDEAAAARLYQARADQTTGDTPGLLPTPIVGAVVNLIDANRPLITSLGGAKGMGGIPGTQFNRPKVTVHAQSGKQTAEKTALPSRKMTVGQVTFTKETHGGYVDISRQDIDWTSPSAWDILVRDLANVYAIDVETAVATAFLAASTAATAVPVATNDLKGWTLALYTAAMHSYKASFLMPDRVWCSLDVWAALGSLVDATRVVLTPDGPDTPKDSFDIGASTLADFRGDILGLPRIVVPTLAAGTCIVGNSTVYEVYEETIGLLSVIEPSILGIQVAYGGYVAYGGLANSSLVPLTVPAGMPTMVDAPGPNDDQPEPAADTGGGVSGGRKAGSR